jgi:hypothetical protein
MTLCALAGANPPASNGARVTRWRSSDAAAPGHARAVAPPGLATTSSSAFCRLAPEVSGPRGRLVW